MEDVNTIAPAPSDLPSSSPEDSQQRTDQDEHSSYKASKIAGRFVEVIDPKSHVDTAAPIDSVKGAVTKFGGIRDWRERRLQLQDEIDKVQQEITRYEKRSQEAEAGKARALQDLESTVSAADELCLSLEKSQAEEAQARQERELAELRLGELQLGASESAAAKADLDVVRSRLAAALADLQSARAELASLQRERASQEARKAVENLATELVALKGALESSHAAHAEAEEKRMVLAAAFEQDKSQWQSELEEAELEAKKLREELMAACDLELKTEEASQVLVSLKAELVACTVQEETPSKATLEKANKELEDVKESIDKAKHEATSLRVAAASVRDDLEREKAELAALQCKKELSAASIASLEEELRRATSELAAAEARANKEVHDESKMAEQLGEARREAEKAKGKARSAREEVAKAREDATVAKAAVAATEARLEAVTREIVAANTSEEMATASASALLQEIEAPKKECVTLTVEEYEELSRRAREMEEAGGKRVIEAVKLIKEAKDAEVRSLEKLTRVAKRTEQRRQALQAATEEAEEAEFSKLSAERELRQWRAEQEQQPRTGLAEISVLDDPRGNPHILSPRGGYMPRNEVMVAAAGGDRKTTFFPRMVMFLARKRTQTWK